MSEFKCGYVGLIGRPNAGKSTLLNQVLGSKLAIISSKPQTTRDRIVGVHTDERMQAVLVDTPGIHKAWTELNKNMVSAAMDAIGSCDVVLWVEDAAMLARRLNDEDGPLLDPIGEEIVTALAKSGKTIVFVANKIDVVPKQLLLPVIAGVSERLTFASVVPISALNNDGVNILMDEIHKHLPVHEPLFPEDHWTEVTERFLVGEIIREKIFHLTEQEIPYATAVEIEKFDETERETKGIVKVFAAILVERGSQKGIVIGKGGEMLKRIGTLARKDAQKLLDCRVYLQLFVKVEPDWTKTKKGLKRAGYSS